MLIVVHQARCRIGRRRLLEVDDLQILPGQHWAVFGHNGAGKTLLAELLSGRRRESATYVRYGEGFDPERHCFEVSFAEQRRLWQRDSRLDISDFDATAQDPGTRVLALLQSARPRANSDTGLLQELIGRLSLEPLLDKGIRFLSSGQLRRVLLARGLYGVMAATNRLLLLDEPMESIDRDSRQGLLDCLESYRDRGFASICLTRRVRDIPAGVTHLALMDQLRLTVSGNATAVKLSPDFQRLAHPKPDIPKSLPLRREPQVDEQVLLELRDVEVRYGSLPVLSRVNWTMTNRHHVLIEGPNGCGKSTLLSLIDGENHKGYGQAITLFGRRKGSGESVWEIKSHFGVVSNELHTQYVKGWRVLDVVVSGFFDSVGLYDDSGSEQREVAERWLQTLGFAEAGPQSFRGQYYHELSFGQQRLVLLARAMVKAPSVLILDEPCVGLDDYHRRLLLGLLDRIAELGSSRIVYVSHTAGEHPDCINYRLSFEPLAEGGHTVIGAPFNRECNSPIAQS